MGPNPFLGVIFHWIGGFASATNFIPFRGIKRWSWEVYWLIQGFAAWILAPIVIGSIFVPNLFGILRQSYAEHPKNVLFALLFGMLWGVGGITFGLAIRYLGIALGYAIALGLCAAFGTVVPPIFHGQFLTIMSQTSGQFILLGVAVCIIGVAVKESTSEMITATESVIVNSRNSRPIIPPIKRIGKKTPMSDKLIENTVKATSLVPSRAACSLDRPISMWRAIFSRTTTASSTTNPVAIVKAIREKLFKE